MRRLDVQIPAADGRSHGTLHVPDGDGPWPGVLVFPDAGGTRETFGQMGDRLAGMGYVALIPDIYYRAGQWAPFDMVPHIGPWSFSSCRACAGRAVIGPPNGQARETPL